MRARNPFPSTLPGLWLVTDARNDAALGPAIAKLPRGSGVIFRHYHLAPAERTARLAQVRRWCRRFGHRLEVAGEGYGPPAPHRRLATAHSLHEIGRINRFGAEAVLLSPVFATRSHPDARPLGAVRSLLLARWSKAPVIALGGMTRARARHLRALGWAAIDGLPPGVAN
jgi:thiamine-phosphate pyrophosphorylase